MRHEEEVVRVEAPPADVFAFVDDHALLSSHMAKPSWRTAGATMELALDEGHGQRVGSHIRMDGRILGARIGLDEVVTRREPPRVKEWRTVGTPRLLVVGAYSMRVEIEPAEEGSLLRVGIDYELPPQHVRLGRLFGRAYARWCVRKMAHDARRRFVRS